MIKKSKNIADFIFDIKEKFGFRPAGSESEKNTADYIKYLLEELVVTKKDDFKCNPRYNQHLINFICTSYSLSSFIYIVYPQVSFFILFLSSIILLLDTKFNIRLINLISKKVISQNIISTIKLNDEKKKTVIVSANIDSPYIMKIYHPKLKAYINKLYKGLFFSWFFLMFLSLFKYLDILSNYLDYLSIIPLLGFLMFFYFQKYCVSYLQSFGANNNLSGIAINMHLVNYFQAKKLNNTNLIFVFLGAKESGNEGANNFVQKYYSSFDKSTYHINLDSILGGDISVIESELRSSTNNSKYLLNLIKSESKKIGLNIKVFKEIYRNTASVIFSWNNLNTVTITATDKANLPIKYRTHDDISETVSEDRLKLIYKLCIRLIKRIDEKQQ